MDKEYFLKTGLLEQYVLGLANEDEARQVEHYVEAYPELQEELDSLRSALDEYAEKFMHLPVAELRTRASGYPAKAAGLRFPAWTGAVVFALLGALAYLTLSFYNGKAVADRHYQLLVSEFDALQKECARQEQADRAYAFLSDVSTMPIALNNAGLLPEAFAVVYWNPGQQLAYINPVGLPPPPQGKAYQIWADVDGEMISMGLVDCRRRELQPVRFVENAENLNITLEPEGGSDGPTVSHLCANGKL